MDTRKNTLNELQPVVGKELRVGVNFAPNLVVKKGQIMALIVAAAVTATYTLTFSGSPTAGTFKLSYRGNPTDPITYSGTAATLRENIRKALIALPGCEDGDWVITGTGPITISGAGRLAGLPIEPITISSQSITGGTVAAAAGVTGVAGNRHTIYDGSVLAAPAANAVSYTGTGSAGTWAAGTYMIQHTWETAAGETTPSPLVPVTLTGSQSLRVNAVNAAGTPDTAVYLNIYCNGGRIAQISVTTPGSSGNVAQTDIAGAASATGADGKRLPTSNTAYTNTDGTAVAKGIAPCDFRTNNKGQVIRASREGIVSPVDSIDILVGGCFKSDDLIGLTADAVRDLGAKWRKGSLGVAGSLLDLPFSAVN